MREASSSAMISWLSSSLDAAGQVSSLFFFFFCYVLHLWNLSSPTGDGTCTLALEAWLLNHWTAREVPPPFLSILPKCFKF